MAEHDELDVGTCGPTVARWQQMLQRARLLDDASGTYDADTATATRAWQTLHGLAPTGRVDAAAWVAAQADADGA
jgi:peptidoglycan hydrolase-like protein with peptidoglycan-binding domain